MEPQHLIQKYCFDVAYDSEETAYDFQLRVASLIKEKIVKLTDELFTEICGGNNIRINKLELDLGDIDLGSFDGDFYDRLKAQLRDKLKLLLAGVKSDPDEVIEFVSVQESRSKNLEYFFESGVLPWSARNFETSFYVQGLVREMISESPAALRIMFERISTREEVKLRIIRQLPDEVLWTVLKLWDESVPVSHRKFYEWVTELYVRKKIFRNYRAEFRELLWKYIWREIVVVKKYKPTVEALTREFLKFVSREIASPLDKVLSEFVAVSAGTIPGLEKLSSGYTASATSPEARAFWETALKSFTGKGAPAGGHAYTTEIIRAAVELFEVTYGKEPVSSPVEPGTMSDIAETRKVSERKDSGIHSEGEYRRALEKYEQLKEEKLQRKREYLIRFFTNIFYFPEKAEILSNVSKAERILHEFAFAHPAVLKQVLDASAIDLRTIHGQEMVKLLAPRYQVLILEHFGISREKFNEFQIAAAHHIIRVFLETGFFPFAELPAYYTKEDIVPLFERGMELRYEEITRQLKEQVIGATEEEKQFKILQLRKFLPAKFLKKHFHTFPDIVKYKAAGKNETAEGKKDANAFSEERYAAKVLSAELLQSADAYIYVLEYFLEYKKFPQKVVVAVSEVIQRFYKEYREEARVYFAALKESAFRRIQKEIPEQILPELKQTRVQAREVIRHDILKETELSPPPVKPEVNGEKSSDPVYEFKKSMLSEPVYINNAGLVLMHPYLNRFFKIAGLLDKRDFKDEFSAHKAVYLLQYLVDKGTDHEEHRLFLNKLLCGVDPAIPLMREIEISQEEKDLCESLIEGAVRNWTVLKNTSNDNFRASFLMREGRLQLDQQGWKLKVEERGYDILIEKLPWSIAMVRLPWMKQVIYVEWR